MLQVMQRSFDASFSEHIGLAGAENAALFARFSAMPGDCGTGWWREADSNSRDPFALDGGNSPEFEALLGLEKSTRAEENLSGNQGNCGWRVGISLYSGSRLQAMLKTQ
jgi:hypothetical protein